MRKTVMFAAAFAALSGFLPSTLHAQGTLYVSNLGQNPIGSLAVGRDSWVAQTFFAGTNSTGYLLDSVELLMNASLGNPGAFSVSIYDYDIGSSGPGMNLGNLNGLPPMGSGLFTYSSDSITLSPGRPYFVVVTSDTPIAQGAYNWSAGPGAGNGGGDRGDDGWGIGYLNFTSSEGTSWNYARDKYFQMGVYATPVPEPSVLALVGIGGLLLAGTRLCRRKSA